MGSKIIDGIQARDRTITILLIVVVGLIVLNMTTVHGWKSIQNDVRVTVPPNNFNGVTLKPGEFDQATVYGFTKSTFKALNRWVNNGQVEYAENIEKYRVYFTPKFFSEVSAHYKKKNDDGELKDRSRYMLDVIGSQVFNADDVETLNDGSWVVTVKVDVKEHIGKYLIKETSQVYPLHIVRLNIDPELNKWGLAINGIAENREVITRVEQENKE